RAIVEAEHGREKRRLDARVRALALERLDQAGLLAADVGRRAAVDDDVAAVSGAQYIVARVALLLRLEDRLVEQLRGQRQLVADGEAGLRDCAGEGGDHDPLDELVRVPVDDLAGLQGARLGLVAVADEVERLARLAVDEAPLHAAGEARAASAAQAGLL